MRVLVVLSLAVAVAAVAPAPAAAGGEVSKIIYVNRCVGGCMVTKSGSNSAVDNTSIIPDGNEGEVSVISEWAHGDEVWAQLMECVRDMYSPYDVVVTDVDPSPMRHHEAIAAGNDFEIGVSAGGISGVYSSCTPTDNVISYTFANQFPPSQVEAICAVVGQESGHSFGMPDHLYDCTDPMTYLGWCGRAYFRNKSMPCGEFALNSPPCACGGVRVNSHVMLSEALGPGTQPPPPTVGISYPPPDAQIGEEPIFQIAASDPRGVVRIEIFLNGWLWKTFNERDSIVPPFSWPESYNITFTEPIPPGIVDVEVRAYNDLGLPGAFAEGPSYSIAEVTVLRGDLCTSADQCFEGQLCEEGRCFWEQPTGELGETCEFDQQCIGENTYDGHCAESGDGPICTYECVAGINDLCPEDYHCPGDEGEQGFCMPGDGEPPPGCCSTGGDSRASIVFVLLVGLVLLRRRPR
jgi:hypothetical protein